MPQHPPDRLVHGKRSTLPPPRAFTRRRMGLKRSQSIGVNNEGNLQLIQASKEGPELGQVQIFASHVSTNDHCWHLEFFHSPCGLSGSSFGILQGKRGGPEVTGGLPTGGNHFGQPVVVLARGLHGHLGIGSIEHMGGMKDQHLLIDALLVEICQPAVQIPSSADIDGGLMRSGCFALWRSQIEAGPAKLHEVSTVGEQRDLKGTAFQSFDDRDMTINIDDLHGILLWLCLLGYNTTRSAWKRAARR